MSTTLPSLETWLTGATSRKGVTVNSLHYHWRECAVEVFRRDPENATAALLLISVLSPTDTLIFPETGELFTAKEAISMAAEEYFSTVRFWNLVNKHMKSVAFDCHVCDMYNDTCDKHIISKIRINFRGISHRFSRKEREEIIQTIEEKNSRDEIVEFEEGWVQALFAKYI